MMSFSAKAEAQLSVGLEPQEHLIERSPFTVTPCSLLPAKQGDGQFLEQTL